MTSRRIALLLLMTWIPACLASTSPQSRMLATLPVFSAEHKARFSGPVLRRSTQEPLLFAAAGKRCEVSALPQALATPDPLLDGSSFSNKVGVSFIVGRDGRVHSPVILESAGSDEDELVLQTLRTWRYRPAMCNAQPTETETHVEFSRR